MAVITTSHTAGSNTEPQPGPSAGLQAENSSTDTCGTSDDEESLDCAAGMIFLQLWCLKQYARHVKVMHSNPLASVNAGGALCTGDEEPKGEMNRSKNNT